MGEVLEAQSKTDNVVKDIRIVLADIQQALRNQQASLDLLLERDKWCTNSGGTSAGKTV